MIQKMNETDSSFRVISRKTENLFETELNDELILMRAQTGEYITLNKVAKIIWKKIEQPTTFEELINHLLSQFNVSKEICISETNQLLEKLNNEGLLN